MSGANRQGTKQESIIDSIFHSLRNLDKITWLYYDKLDLYADDLIEDAEYIKTRLDDFITTIRHQVWNKKKPSLDKTQLIRIMQDHCQCQIRETDKENAIDAIAQEIIEHSGEIIKNK